MPHTTRKATRWGKVKAWRSHSIACWDSEWAEWQRAAEMQGKSVNGWIRDGLKEIVRYERLVDGDRPGPGSQADVGD